MKGVLPSPSFRESMADGHQAKKTGCMPSIFFFFHRHHHTHSRKRLSAAAARSSGKKDQQVVVTPPPAEPKPTTAASHPKRAPAPSAGGVKKVSQKRAGSAELSRSGPADLRRSSCEVPRSPTIPAEIRLPKNSNNHGSSPETPRRSPALLARLMGLEELPVAKQESAAEKRRKLLGALEKCDEDLLSLKKIIEALHLGGVRKAPDVGGENRCMVAAAKGRCGVEEEQHPSPVSVLDGVPSTSPLTRGGLEKRRKGAARDGCAFLRRAVMERVPKGGGRRKGRRRWREASSRAMVEAVEEVWDDGHQGERWERGKVGVALEGGILVDLVEEVVEEMELCWSERRGSSASVSLAQQLPFESCRRRLRF